MHCDLGRVREPAARKKGFIALMTTIIIGLVLLVMAVEEGSSGWYARFNILGTEAKEQASALAEGCADQALAALVTNPFYAGDATTTTVGGSCYVFPVLFNTPIQGVVTIKTQAEVRGSYANLEMTMNTNDLHLGAIPLAPSSGTIVVITHVINDSSGTKQASDFTMHIGAPNPSKNDFPGAEGGVGVTIPVPVNPPGGTVAYSVSETAVAGYLATVSPTCSGAIAAGEIKFCTITNDDITTTLTVIANVINNDTGTKQPADFPLFIDGAPATIGQRYAVSAGSHTVSATTLSGYAASLWGYDCAVPGDGTITVNLSQNKTCIINFDDIPPPTPICAETVMMLDRTGSMSSADLAGERTAANSLVNLYSTVSPLPKIGVGSFGGLYGGTAAQVPDNTHPVVGWLTTVYSVITNAVNTITASNSSVGSDLSAAISVGNAELNSVRHVAGKEKVLILVSDGVPNQPSGSAAFDTGLKSPSANVQNASGDLWSNPTNAYADGGGDASDPVSENDRHRFYNFGFGSGSGLPSGSTITGIEALADAWATANAAPAVFFSDGFGTGSDLNDIPNWDETGSDSTATTLARAAQPSGEDTASPDGGRFAKIENAEWICRSIDASGFQSLVLKYYWRGDADAEDNESGFLEYQVGGSGCTATTGWNTIASHELDDGNRNTASWSTLQSVNLPAALNNAAFFFRIRNAANDSAEFFRVDGISITGTPTPALSCQLGMDLSWNGGTSWSSEKTQTLTGTEATYTLGSPSDDWTSSHTWQPSEFSDTNFRARVHAIDPGSSCDNSAIEHLDWLRVKIHYTQPTDPTAAAYAAADAAKQSGTSIFTIHFGDASGRDLLARLASGSTPNPPHENGSFNDPGGVVNGNTGLASPTTQVADTGGDGNGFEVNPANAFADGPSGLAGAAQNIDGAGDRHRFSGYNFALPPNATVTGIQTRLDWWLDSTSGTNSMGVELSWDGGAHWTSAKTAANESTSVSHSDTLGSGSDTWGRAWAAGDFNSGNFAVRITSNSTSASRDFFLDWAPVQVFYTVIQENGDGDNFFISPTSADMEGIFHFIGQQVCPASLHPAAPPPPTTGTLIVITNVVNNNGGANQASDFTAHVNAVNPSISSFGGDAAGVSVTVGPGDYSVTEDTVNGYIESPGATCSSAGSTGPIAAGETRVCVFTNDDIPPPPPPPNLNINTGSWQEVPNVP